jgi:hypothetical protein
MSTLSSELLTNIFRPGPVMVKRDTAASDLFKAPGDEGWTGPQTPARRRTRLWELNELFYCSIIGTCLSTGELRRVLVRQHVDDAATMTDHECHNVAVRMASHPKDGAKLLHKALDRRHQVALGQFAKARDVAAVVELWDRALKNGDIPGAYWALLTHQLASEEVLKKAFSDVHMLSHLVGAANRADIRRLRQLEDENAALAAKLERQQAQLREGFVERDNTIRKLNEALRQAAVQNSGAIRSQTDADTAGWVDTIAGLDRSLARETARGERLEQRLAAATRALQETEKKLRRAEDESADLKGELTSLEERVGLLLNADGDATGQPDLGGMTVLYAGGRKGHVRELKGLLERFGGHLLHHDGGIDDNATLLPGFVSQSDVVVFPVDCVSHGAVGAVKRIAQLSGKRYIPLRTSSAACLVAALAALPPALTVGPASA